MVVVGEKMNESIASLSGCHVVEEDDDARASKTGRRRWHHRLLFDTIKDRERKRSALWFILFLCYRSTDQKRCLPMPSLRNLLLVLCVQGIHGFVVPHTKHQSTTTTVRYSETPGKKDVVISGTPNGDGPTYSNGYVSPPEINGYTMPKDQRIGYSAFLERDEPRWLKKVFFRRTATDDDMDEDGYADMQLRKGSVIDQALKFPLKAAKRILFPKPVEPGTLILVRHGESAWNKNKTFTGWADPDLTDQGRREVEHAARLLMEGGYKIDVVFTSRLKRAIRSVWIILQEMNKVYLPVFKSWRLNEVSEDTLQANIILSLQKYSLILDAAHVRGLDRTQQEGNGRAIGS